MALSGWSGEKLEIKIVPDNIDSNLTNFPVNIILSELAGAYNSNLDFIFNEIGGDANRKKIAVAFSDDSTELFVEIEHWDNANKQASLHVKIPSISAATGATLFLYADSAHADNTAYVGDTGDAAAKLVWDSNFKGVYHFAQDPSGGTLTDSTSNTNDGTNVDAMIAGDLVTVSNKKAWHFLNQRVNLGTFLPMVAWQDFTIEHFAKPDDITGRNIWDTGRGAGNYLRAGYTNGGYPQLDGSNADGDITIINSNPLVAVNQEIYHVATRGSSTGTTSLYSDTYPDGDVVSDNISYQTFDNSEDFYLNTLINSYYGDVVEFRISDMARSEAWKKATFHSSNDNLIDYGLRSGSADITFPLLIGSATTPTGNATGSLPHLTVSAASNNHAVADITLPLLTSSSLPGMVGDISLPLMESYGEGEINEIFIADLTLPALTSQMNSGFSAEIEFKPLIATSTGIHVYPFIGNGILPSLTSYGTLGAIGSVKMANIEAIGTGLQGIVGNVNLFLPKLIAEAYLNVVQTGTIDIRLKRLIGEATGTVGGAWDLIQIFPKLTVEINAIFGIIGNGNITLPAIEEAGMSSYNDIIGNGSGTININ